MEKKYISLNAYTTAGAVIMYRQEFTKTEAEVDEILRDPTKGPDFKIPYTVQIDRVEFVGMPTATREGGGFSLTAKDFATVAAAVAELTAQMEMRPASEYEF